MSTEVKIVKKYTALLKDMVYVIALILALAGAYYKMQQSIQTNNVKIDSLVEDISSLQAQVEKSSTLSNENSTGVKVLETQIEILRSTQ